ncbi:Anoctamin-7, partial [Halocaridina rubra]
MSPSSETSSTEGDDVFAVAFYRRNVVSCPATFVLPQHGGGGGDSDSWRSSGGIEPPVGRQNEEATTFFRDGRRRIDYVLVYDTSRSSLSSSSSSTRKPGEEGGETSAGGNRTASTSSKKSSKYETWRHRFMASLEKAGLHMEEEIQETGKGPTCFIKLSAPWNVLCHYAEELNMRAPLQSAGLPLVAYTAFSSAIKANLSGKSLLYLNNAYENPSTNWSEVVLKKLCLPNLMAEDVPNKPKDYSTCAFKKSKID